MKEEPEHEWHRVYVTESAKTLTDRPSDRPSDRPNAIFNALALVLQWFFDSLSAHTTVIMGFLTFSACTSATAARGVACAGDCVVRILFCRRHRDDADSSEQSFLCWLLSAAYDVPSSHLWIVPNASTESTENPPIQLQLFFVFVFCLFVVLFGAEIEFSHKTHVQHTFFFFPLECSQGLLRTSTRFSLGALCN